MTAGWKGESVTGRRVTVFMYLAVAVAGVAGVGVAAWAHRVDLVVVSCAMVALSLMFFTAAASLYAEECP